MLEPATPKIVTPDLILPVAIFSSIDAVTALRVILVMPFLPVDGVIVCAEVVAVAVVSSPTNSTTVPVTSNITTPALKF